MANFEGKYQLESSENFDEFLKALGVNFMIRQFAKTSTPTIEVRREGDYFVIKTSTTFKTSEIKFKLDEEFEESRMDGNTVKTRVVQDGNKLVQTQYGDKEVKIVRDFSDTKLTTVCTFGDIVSTRVYKRL